MAATVAEKAPVVWPEETVTLVGTVTLALLLASATVAPPLGAAADKVTVQLEEPGATTVDGAQLSAPGWTLTVRLRVADWLWPLRVAVTVAFWGTVIVPVVAEKAVLL